MPISAFSQRTPDAIFAFLDGRRPGSLAYENPDAGKIPFYFLAAFTVTLTAGTFVLDLTAGWALVCTVPYLFLVLIGLWLPRWYTVAAAGGGTVLNFAGYLHGAHSGETPEMTLNRFLCLIGIWVTAALCWQCRRNAEVLFEREAVVQAIINNSLDGKIVVTARGSIEYLNTSAEKIFGYTSAELAGQNISRLFGGRNESAFRLARGLAEISGYRKNGSVCHLEAVVSEAHIGGRSMFVIAVCDISVRRQAEMESGRAKRQLQLILDAAAEGIWGLDLNGTTTFINPAAEKMLGYAAGGLLGKKMHALVHHSRLDGSVYPEEECPIYAAFKEGACYKRDNEVFWRQDGSSFPVEYLSSPIVESGKITGAVVVFKDITERRQVEEMFWLAHEKLEQHVAARTEQLRKLSCAVEQSPCAVIITDTSGAIEYVNPKFTRLSGYTLDEVAGKNPRILKSAKTPPGQYTALWQQITAGNEWYGEFHNRRKDGGSYWGLSSISPIRNAEGMITHYLSVMEDITERKRVEEQLTVSLKENETLLKEVHHRTKNNMQIVSSLLRLQARCIPEKKYSGMFQESFNRIRSMALIHEMVCKSASLLRVNAREYILTLAQELLRSYDWSAGKIALDVDAEEVALNLDTGIPVGLIVTELIANALKHAFPDGRRGIIAVSLRHIDAGTLELIVRDDGVGVPAGFDLFNTSSLGLQLVTMLIKEQLHGRIFCEKRGGSTFKMLFKEKL